MYFGIHNNWRLKVDILNELLVDDGLQTSLTNVVIFDGSVGKRCVPARKRNLFELFKTIRFEKISLSRHRSARLLLYRNDNGGLTNRYLQTN
jgi:hypothetical protein